MDSGGGETHELNGLAEGAEPAAAERVGAGGASRRLRAGGSGLGCRGGRTWRAGAGREEAAEPAGKRGGGTPHGSGEPASAPAGCGCSRAPSR